jgi:hypothetical protein
MSIISKLFEVGASMVSLFRRKPKWTEAVPLVISQVLPLVNDAIVYGGMDSKEKFDSWLEGFDRATGSDPGAVNVIHDIPADKLEEFYDHIKEAARIFGYAKLGVPGFTV